MNAGLIAEKGRVLAKREARDTVEYCLTFGDGDTYWLGDYAIMPNHVHALVRPAVGSTLKKIVDAWYAVSTHKINPQLGRRGRLWQEDAFDHIVRDQPRLDRIREYIRNNGKCLPPEHYTIGAGLLFK